MIVVSAALCLAINIFHEARGEAVMGQYAVAFVTLNRAKYDESKVCQEVFKHKQFSWANSGVTKQGAGWKLSSGLVPRDDYAWWMAQRIAVNAMSGRMKDTTQGAHFYHAQHVSPYWKTSMVLSKKVGNHIFYTVPSKS